MIRKMWQRSKTYLHACSPICAAAATTATVCHSTDGNSVGRRRPPSHKAKQNHFMYLFTDEFQLGKFSYISQRDFLIHKDSI